MTKNRESAPTSRPVRRAASTSVAVESESASGVLTPLPKGWGTRYTATGKCIWTEQCLTGPDPSRDPPAYPPELMFQTPGDFDGDLDALSFGDVDIDPSREKDR